jgi:hypothetical protein
MCTSYELVMLDVALRFRILNAVCQRQRSSCSSFLYSFFVPKAHFLYN